MTHKKHSYTTIQVNKDINKHIKEFCKKYKVSAASITELMWVSYMSSSTYIKEIMSLSPDAKETILSSSYKIALTTMSGSAFI
jgi:hypothetical protein